jgi:hypothetical protein
MSRSRIARTLLLVGGASVLVVLIGRVGIGVIADMLRRVGWAILAVSALYAVHVAARAAALWRSLPPPPLSYADVLRVRLSGEAVEMLTLSGPFIAQPMQGWLLTRRGFSGADAYGGVALEYLLYCVVSAWMAAAALAMLLARGVLAGAMHAPVVGLIAVTIAFTVGFFIAAFTGAGLIVPIVRRLGPIVGRDRAESAALRLDPVERVLVSFMHDRPARLAEVFAIEAGGHALLALEIWVVVRALGLHVAPVDPFIVEGSTKFIGVVFFFIPGQVGVSESVYTLPFEAIGLPAAAGLTMALVRRIRALIVAGGALAVLAWTPGERTVGDSHPTRS